MFIDFEAEEMIIPKNIIPVTPSFKVNNIELIKIKYKKI
jgi:hypothetical protein